MSEIGRAKEQPVRAQRKRVGSLAVALALASAAGGATRRGVVLTKVRAASLLVSPPVLMMGSAAQGKPVRGRSLGVVK